jgi:DNA-directed RNA polymerase subunit beta
MATKKTTTPKNASKSSPLSSKEKKTPAKTPKKVEKAVDTAIEKVSKKLTAQADTFFANYHQVDGRIFLSNPKSYGEIPDLLELQKKGYTDFLEYYLPKLFEGENPIWDIGGNKLNITISDIKVSEPAETIEVCKKKELTYGGIITAKIKLVEIIEDEKTKKKSEKVLFSKKANVGILPVMTPSATYIINGVERVIISQIVRSYGIFYSKKDLRYGCKLIPENGPWLEIDVEKF